VKWIVRPALGEHPAPHRLALLTAAGFAGMPRPWGLLLWHDPSAPAEQPALLASVAELVPGAQDGWDWAVQDGRAVARGELLAPYDLLPAVALGELCADLHLALATGGSRPATGDEARTWHGAALATLDEATDLAATDRSSTLPPLRARATTALRSLAYGAGTPLLPVHGDLHVGQVLRTADGPADGPRYLLPDFDGSPVLPAGERAAPMPAALDVAAMMQSIDHVGRIVVHRTPGVDADLVTGWARRAQAAFLDTYRASLRAAGRPELLDERLLAAFRVQQECREHVYAARHLPHWSYVPEAAMPALLDELDQPDQPATDGG
jgi:maltokinase